MTPQRGRRGHALTVKISQLLSESLPRRARKGREPQSCYVPCEGCGRLLLTGVTTSGQRLALEPGIPTYVVVWENQAPVPRLVPSQGYPVHQCGKEAAGGGVVRKRRC